MNSSLIKPNNQIIINTINQLQKNFKYSRSKINILFCDIQEKYIPKIANNKEIIQKARIMAELSKIASLKQIISLQKKEVFGDTVKEITINLTENSNVFNKSTFAMFTEEEIEKFPLDDVYVLIGIESHVCVFQTALNFQRKNRNLIVLADCVSSTNLGERKIALDTLRELGCFITTCQSFIFLMLEDANHPEFKSYLNLLKDLSQISSDLLLDKENEDIRI